MVPTSTRLYQADDHWMIHKNLFDWLWHILFIRLNEHVHTMSCFIFYITLLEPVQSKILPQKMVYFKCPLINIQDSNAFLIINTITISLTYKTAVDKTWKICFHIITSVFLSLSNLRRILLVWLITTTLSDLQPFWANYETS